MNHALGMIDAGAPAQRRRALQQLDRGLSRRLAALRHAMLETAIPTPLH